MYNQFFSKGRELGDSNNKDDLMQLFEECEQEVDKFIFKIQIWKSKYERSLDAIRQLERQMNSMISLDQFVSIKMEFEKISEEN